MPKPPRTRRYPPAALTREVLAAPAPGLQAAARTAAAKAFVLLDGTLLPIDCIAVDQPYYSGKHKKPGTNVQVIADPRGRRRKWGCWEVCSIRIDQVSR